MKHETSEAHLNAKVAEALFLQERSIAASLKQQNELESERRKKQVILNKFRKAYSRYNRISEWSKFQGLSFRGDPEVTKALI